MSITMCYKAVITTILLIFLQLKGNLAASDEERLIDFLLNSTRYHASARPVVSYTDVLPVRHSTQISQLIKLDEKNQVITTSAKIRLEWQDAHLLWEPLTYGGIKEMNIDMELIWSPKLALFNDADGSVEEIATPRAIVENTGKVSAVFPRILKCTCEIIVRDFPFDRQICQLKFGSFQYDVSRMDLQPITDKIDTSNFVPNGEWNLAKTRVTREIVYHAFSDQEGFVQLSYTMALDRKPLYYICNFLLPIVLIEIITILLFLIPPQTGEQMAVGVTLLLSQAVFFLLLEDKIPETSDFVPLIGKYYACCIFEVSMAVGFICLVLRLHHHDATEVPVWVKKYLLGYVAHALNITVKQKRYRKRDPRRAFLNAQQNAFANPAFEKEATVNENDTNDTILEALTEEEVEAVKPQALIWLAKVELARRKRKKAGEANDAWKTFVMPSNRLNLVGEEVDEKEKAISDESEDEFDKMESDDISLFERFIHGLQENDRLEQEQEDLKRKNGIPLPPFETVQQKQKRSLRLMAEGVKDERRDRFLKRQWQMVGKVINYLAMLLYIVASVITFLVCFGSVLSGSDVQEL